MGLVCSSRLLVGKHLTSYRVLLLTLPQKMVPSLIESIKIAGLVLVTDTSEESAPTGAAARSYRMPEGVDGVLRYNGVLRFNEAIDM